MKLVLNKKHLVLNDLFPTKFQACKIMRNTRTDLSMAFQAAQTQGSSIN